MKNLFVTTALALMLSTSAYADSHTHSDMFSTYEAQQTDLAASNVIGMRVYSTEMAIANDVMIAQGDEANWDDIGEVNDLILSRDGSVLAVILGIGGFIGIGEKNVAVSMSEIQFVKKQDDADGFFLVVKSNAQALKDAPEYKSTMMDKSENVTMTNADRPMLTAPIVEREGYNTVEMKELTAERLLGARVYGSSDEDIGEVGSLLLSKDGQIERAVLDIGGFLEMGEHRIAVTLKELNIVTDKDGSDVRVYVDSSKEALMAQPAYKAN
ncbi:PRC-barrel domain-containing protein [Maritalea sp.]|uniref:PRC-barrel domain-containing protein n=1 Tax=Maritalea sp. TaxID=2003361 RepID=UPI003EF7E3B3